jgi:hypothetical protein
MNPRLAALAPLIAVLALTAGCYHTDDPRIPDDLSADEVARLTRPWNDPATSTTSTVPRMDPVARVDGIRPEVWTTCDRGHRLYVLEDGDRAGITALVDPGCPSEPAR